MAVCNVTGRLTRITTAPIEGAVVAWRLDTDPNAPSFVGGDALAADDELIETTDVNGEFAINLTQGARMVVRIPALNVYRQVRIPTQASATLEEVLNADV